MGYGLAEKGVKLPWYLERPSEDVNVVAGKTNALSREETKKKSGKKTLEELREERLRREKREKERERALIFDKTPRDRDIRHRDKANPKHRKFYRR